MFLPIAESIAVRIVFPSNRNINPRKVSVNLEKVEAVGAGVPVAVVSVGFADGRIKRTVLIAVTKGLEIIGMPDG